MMKVHALAGAAMLFCAPAAAQTLAPAAAPIAAPTYNGAVLRTGTEVPLKLTEELTTKGKKLKPGQRFHMEVAENVMLQNQVVIPAGSPAMGEITDVRNKGMWGKSGHLAAKVIYVTVNGRQIRMTGTFDDKGTAGGVGAAAASALVFLPAGFFMTGTSARVAIGTPVKGFVDEDVPLTMAAVGPAPLAVGAQPAVQSVPAAVPVLTPIADVKAK